MARPLGLSASAVRGVRTIDPTWNDETLELEFRAGDVIVPTSLSCLGTRFVFVKKWFYAAIVGRISSGGYVVSVWRQIFLLCLLAILLVVVLVVHCPFP